LSAVSPANKAITVSVRNVLYSPAHPDPLQPHHPTAAGTPSPSHAHISLNLASGTFSNEADPPFDIRAKSLMMMVRRERDAPVCPASPCPPRRLPQRRRPPTRERRRSTRESWRGLGRNETARMLTCPFFFFPPRFLLHLPALPHLLAVLHSLEVVGDHPVCRVSPLHRVG